MGQSSLSPPSFPIHRVTMVGRPSLSHLTFESIHRSACGGLGRRLFSQGRFCGSQSFGRKTFAPDRCIEHPVERVQHLTLCSEAIPGSNPCTTDTILHHAWFQRTGFRGCIAFPVLTSKALGLGGGHALFISTSLFVSTPPLITGRWDGSVIIL